ncbi:MAG TPA: universal stress protein [Terriglobales bacterium]|nr:universal stress protein [Terriglobales bacterium]
MPMLQANLRLSLKTILFTTDFSLASEAALPYVQALVRWYGSKVVVAHSVPPEPALSVPLDAAPLNMNLNWQQAQNKMTAFLRTDPLPGVVHETVLEQGELWDVLSDLIRRHDIDLVVLGTHGRKGLKKLVLGSAAEQIFRLAPCPVLTVGPNAARPTVQFENWKRILFATDFSAGSLKALPYALSMAEENNAQLMLLHTIPLVPVQQQEDVQEGARRRLEKLIPPDASDWCQPEFVVRFEFPADGILKVAEERQADLVVMGVRATASPRTSAHLPWATAYEVVCRAHCPVLTVRG